MSDFIEYSDKLHEKAKRLLKEFSFEELAKKHFGNIVYTGSFVFNLMIDADIDSNIICSPLDKAKIMAFADDLTDIPECRKVILYNRLHEKPSYFVINVERFVFEDETWTLTFFIQESDFQNAINKSEEIKSSVTPENRKLILELKDWRVKARLKADIPSVWVYDAVLDKGITDLEMFKGYVKSKNPNLLSR